MGHGAPPQIPQHRPADAAARQGNAADLTRNGLDAFRFGLRDRHLDGLLHDARAWLRVAWRFQTQGSRARPPKSVRTSPVSASRSAQAPTTSLETSCRRSGETALTTLTA